MPNRRDRHSVKARKPTDDRRVVGVTTVAMDFHEVFEQPLDEIEGVRPIRMARKLHPLESCGWILLSVFVRHCLVRRGRSGAHRRSVAFPVNFATERAQSIFELRAALDSQ